MNENENNAPEFVKESAELPEGFLIRSASRAEYREHRYYYSKSRKGWERAGRESYLRMGDAKRN